MTVLPGNLQKRPGRNPGLFLCLLLALASCMPMDTAVPAASGPQDRIRDIFARIDARNRTMERTDAWLRRAYRGIAARDLSGIRPEDYARYRSFARDGKVYIIVHPGYFPFFDEGTVTPITTDYSGGFPRKDLVERVADRLRPTDVSLQVTLQQEQAVRDFIEFVSEEKRLTVLVLPGNYRRHLVHGYVAGYDEYARYVNELTNDAENIVTIRSNAPDSGYLQQKDIATLGRFLDAAGVHTLLLGGGFLGTCLDNVAASLRQRYRYDQIWYVADLTTVSPAAVIADRIHFLSFWGTLRPKQLRDYFATVPYNRTTREPIRWADLSRYTVFRAP